MRIVSTVLFAGFVMGLAGSFSPADKSKTVVGTGIDPIVTGQKISQDHLDRWKTSSSLYRKCPQCVASQPFPGD